jgi:diaminopimelate decarboxylase
LSTALQEYWTPLVEAAAAKWSTPFYLGAWKPIEDAIRDLQEIRTRRPLRHWLSVKTQPLKPLLRCWRHQGWGAEVASEYELLAAVAEGFVPEAILVNGVAKHTWLMKHRIRGLNVHLDSLTEALEIRKAAGNLNWRLGLRLHLAEEHDPDEPQFGGQFGMTLDEAKTALELLSAEGLKAQGLHFHLRSNVESPEAFGRALSEAAGFCKDTNWNPKYVDTGGGLPDPGVTPGIDTQYFSRFGSALDAFTREVQSIEQVWMEHGRFVSGRSAVLVLRVVDSKLRPECRYVLCDGGRTNHALVSDWENHPIIVLPRRRGRVVLTTVTGATCMAYDRLARLPLPEDLSVGDPLLSWPLPIPVVR